MAKRRFQQILAENDGAKTAQYLFEAIEAASRDNGPDMSGVVAEVVQGAMNSKWNASLKNIMYDLCKLVTLSDADSNVLISGMKGDVQSGDADLTCLALRYLPHIQPHLLATMLTSGDLTSLCGQNLVAEEPSIRAAAVDALSAVLLAPEVLRVAGTDASLASQFQEHWQGITDCLLDEHELVATCALSATATLLRAGGNADSRLPEGYLLECLAFITAARVRAALGPILQASADVPMHGRVLVMQLLELVVQHAVRAGHWEAADLGGALGMPSGTLVPGMASLAPSVWAYCSDLIKSATSAERYQAAHTILQVASLVNTAAAKATPAGVTGPHATPGSMAGRSSSGGADNGPVLTTPGPGSVAIPTDLVQEALEVILAIEDTLPFGEAGSDELLDAAIGGLAALPVAKRLQFIAKLWEAVYRVKATPARISLCVQLWHVVVQAEDASGSPSLQSMNSNPLGGSLASIATGQMQMAQQQQKALSQVLSSPYIVGVLTGRMNVSAASSATGLVGAAAAGGAGSASLSKASKAPSASLPPTQSAGAVAVAPSTEEIMQRAPSGDGRAPDGKGKSRFFGFNRGTKKKDSSVSGRDLDSPAAQTPPPVQRIESRKDSTPVLDAPSLSPSVAGGQQASAGSLSKHGGFPMAGAQRHELLVALLGVLQHIHPCSSLAAQVSVDVASTSAHDTTAASVLKSKYPAFQLRRVLEWVDQCKVVLQATIACLHWEPHVIPIVTHHINPSTATKPAADFQTTAQDAWLQLLQAATAAANAVREIHKPAQPQLPAAPILGGEQSLASRASAMPVTPTAHPLPSQASFASTADGSTITAVTTTTLAGQNSSMIIVPAGDPVYQAAVAQLKEYSILMKHMLREWATLSRPLKPRVLWVVAHALDMAPHADEQWELGLAALQDTLSKLVSSGNAPRVQELLQSAAQGLMFASGRMGYARDRAYIFDKVSASAACERHDYEACGMYVALSAAQTWASRLQDALAHSTVDTAKRVTSDVVFQAGRLDGVLRDFMMTLDAIGSPVLRDWVKRIMRSLAACATFVHPAVRAQEEAEKTAKEAEEEAERRAKDGYSSDDSSIISSSSSDSGRGGGGGGDLLPVSLPTAMYLPRGPGGQQPRPALPPVSAFGAATQQAQQAKTESDLAEQSMMNAFMGSPAAVGPGGENRDQESFKNRAALLQGALPAHMVPSSSAYHPWGYPFAPSPRAAVLHTTRRSNRSRTLSRNLAAALATLKSRSRALPGRPGHAALHGNAALNEASVLRLDSPTFWAMLTALDMAAPQGVVSGVSTAEGLGTRRNGVLVQPVELCGPGDPLMVIASVMTSTEPGQLMLQVTATNRSDVEMRGSVLCFHPSGPCQLEPRAAAWSLPKLTPGDSITRSFRIRVTGYGAIILQPRLVLVVSDGTALPVRVVCRSVTCDIVNHLLLPPQASLLTAQDFFRVWQALPARYEVSGACVWPGRQGAAATLSCMLRSSLDCVLLMYTNATASYQAAFAGETFDGESVFVVVHTQLLPPFTAITNQSATTDTVKGNSAPQHKGHSKDQVDVDGESSTADGSIKKRFSKAPSKAAAPAAPEGPLNVVDETIPGPADRARPAQALIHVAIRSSVPEVTTAIQMYPGKFLHDLTAGSAEIAGVAVQGAAMHGAAGPRPPLHPRLLALDAAHAQSLKALPPPSAATLKTAGVDGGLALDVYAQGSKAKSKVSHKWMESAALAEWTRLVSQPV